MIKFKLHLKLAEHRMSQKELSKLMGISQSTISQYYNDKEQSINVNHLNTMCRIFNCDLNEILEYVPDEEQP